MVKEGVNYLDDLKEIYETTPNQDVRDKIDACCIDVITQIGYGIVPLRVIG